MTGEERDRYLAYIKEKKIAPLPLEHKWHKLFSMGEKPANIAELEVAVNDCIKREGSLRTDIKDLKKLKKKLMDGIMNNIHETSNASSKKMRESERLIREINEKIEDYENQLLDLPQERKKANTALLLETMAYCYREMHDNAEEIERISQWIAQMRVELKKNVLRKQDKEIRNKMMYSYMHDIFGPDVIEIFDLEEEQK